MIVALVTGHDRSGRWTDLGDGKQKNLSLNVQNLGLERWSSSHEHWLLVQKTQIQYPVLTWQFITTCYFSPEGSDGLSELLGHCTRVIHRYTCRQNIHTYKIIKTSVFYLSLYTETVTFKRTSELFQRTAPLYLSYALSRFSILFYSNHLFGFFTANTILILLI